jgi:hypothetical protein
MAIQHGADDHLLQVGTMIFAVTVLSQFQAAVAFEVQGGGVEENDLQIGEQIAATLEDAFFDQVFGAAWNEFGGTLLLTVWQSFSEPAHGPVELVQFDAVGLVDEVVVLPALGGTIAAGGAKAMENGKEKRSFDGKIEVTVAEQSGQGLLAAGLAPETFEDQRRSDAPGIDGWSVALAMGGEQEHVLGEASPGGQERIELAGLLEFIESSEGDEDLLAGFAVLARVLDDLQVLPGSGLFDAEEHGDLL